MELILHIGTNKTGSSALQTHMIINREELLHNGYWFVESQEDNKMMKGQISAGNGVNLAKFLHNEDETGLFKYLIELKRDAIKKGVRSIILSNEGIIRLFSNESIISMLESNCQKIGFVKVTCICVLRKPIDHALSLYKHRAKTGKWKNVEEWFNSNYETLKLFKYFFEHYDKYNFDWLFIDYTSNSDELINSFYERGLNLFKTDNFKSLPLFVNKSLNLNNILFIQFIAERFPFMVYKMYEELKKSEYNMEENTLMLEKFQKAAVSYFNNYASTIEKICALVKRSGWMVITSNSNMDSIINEPQSVDIIMTKNHQKYLRYILDNFFLILLREKFLLIKYYVKRMLQFVNKREKFNSSRYGGKINF